MKKKPRPLQRKEKTLRDARLFIIATEDTYAPEAYFRIFRSPKIQVKTLPTEEGLSSPKHVLARLDEYRKEYDANEDDEFWLMLDTDHWIEPNHIHNFDEVCTKSVQKGYQLAHSNPCFEIWLLLHLVELDASNQYANYPEVEQHLRQLCGSYHKKNIDIALFSRDKVVLAIERAKKLDDNPGDRWPQKSGSHVYKIAERLRVFL